MKKLLILFLFIPCSLLAQKSPVLAFTNNTDEAIDKIQANPAINADSAFSQLSNWSDYPTIKQTGVDYLYYYADPFYGTIPLRVYIPASYKNTKKSPCILLLHGATGGSKFTDIDTIKKFDDDIFFSALKKQDYIIIRPVADRAKNFNWSVNMLSFRNKDVPNLTYKTLVDVLINLKKLLNIDDNKVFALGHSDGSDGTIGLGIYSPDLFAGFVAYNSMLNNIFARDFYIRNIINSPLYIVHSDLDKLRPIKTTRRIVDSLKQIGAQIVYKEYIGYEHYDKHLTKDLPYVPQFVNSISRNPFKTKIFWETDKATLYNSCNWIKVTGIDTVQLSAEWHTPFDFSFRNYNERKKEFYDNVYYSSLNKSSAVKASYYNNTFIIETSRVSEIELSISPVMVNMEEPITVMINGKQAFKGKVIADKKFITNGFKTNFDREAIWVNSIKVKTN